MPQEIATPKDWLANLNLRRTILGIWQTDGPTHRSTSMGGEETIERRGGYVSLHHTANSLRSFSSDVVLAERRNEGVRTIVMTTEWRPERYLTGNVMKDVMPRRALLLNEVTHSGLGTNVVTIAP